MFLFVISLQQNITNVIFPTMLYIKINATHLTERVEVVNMTGQDACKLLRPTLLKFTAIFRLLWGTPLSPAIFLSARFPV
jgi:hypothetical protein